MCQTLIYFRLDNLVRFFFVSPDGFYAGTLKAFQKNQYGVLVSPFYLITLYNNITALVIIIVCITLWCNLKRHVRAIEIIAEHRFKRFLVSASISPHLSTKNNDEMLYYHRLTIHFLVKLVKVKNEKLYYVNLEHLWYIYQQRLAVSRLRDVVSLLKIESETFMMMYDDGEGDQLMGTNQIDHEGIA